jgi:hypothetical protein
MRHRTAIRKGSDCLLAVVGSGCECTLCNGVMLVSVIRTLRKVVKAIVRMFRAVDRRWLDGEMGPWFGAA